jgi:hypothetical protein
VWLSPVQAPNMPDMRVAAPAAAALGRQQQLFAAVLRAAGTTDTSARTIVLCGSTLVHVTVDRSRGHIMML